MKINCSDNYLFSTSEVGTDNGAVQKWINEILIYDMGFTLGKPISDLVVTNKVKMNGIDIILFNAELFATYLTKKSLISPEYPHPKGTRKFLNFYEYLELYNSANTSLLDLNSILLRLGQNHIVERLEVVGSNALTCFSPNKSDMDFVVTLNNNWEDLSEMIEQLQSEIPRSGMLDILKSIGATNLQIFFMGKDSQQEEFETGIQFGLIQ